jgi:hypothetical protein
MCPALLYYLAQTWAADRYRQAQHDKPVRAGRQAHRTRTPQRTHRVGGLTAVMARRVRTALGGGGSP